MSLRAKTYRQLFLRSGKTARLSSVNWIIAFVVLMAVLAAILHTEPTIRYAYASTFTVAEIVFGLLFMMEYLARVWSVAEEAGSRNVWVVRARFMCRPVSLLDLLVIVATLTPTFISDAAIFRTVRLVRIMALARFGRFSTAIDEFVLAIKERRQELFLTLGLGLFLLLFSATALYWAEGGAQPEAFGSIPRALWWAVATLTTVGYGDVTPITALGKVLAALVAFGGIGLVAMPAGIMASAYSDAMLRRRAREKEAAESSDTQ